MTAEKILDQAHNAVISIDARGTVTYWNPSAERIFGIARAAAIGRPVADLIIPPAQRAAHRAGIDRITSGAPARMLGRRVELIAQRADGSEFPAQMTIASDREGTVWTFTAFVEDVSERRAAERERERLLEELRTALRESELRFDAIVGSLSDPVTIRSRDDQLVYANRAALEQLDFDSIEALRAAGPVQIMADYRVFAADGHELTMDEIPSVRILRGEPAEPLLIRAIHRVTGADRWRLLKAAPLLDERDELQATIMMTEDVTEQQRHERHAAFLADAGEVLASSLDYELTLSNVARLAVPEIVDWCAVDLLDEDGDRISVAVAHTDPERLRLAKELRDYEPAELDPDQGLGLVLRTGEPLLYPDIPDELLVASARSEHHLDLIRSVGMRSALVVPMRIGDRTLGAMTLVSAESGRTLGAPEVALAQQLAAQAAVAIENSRLYTQRSAIAHTLQQSLLPQTLPEISGYELASAYVPAVAGTEVGGDFYDSWPVPSGWMMAIGDVTGKGIEAASLTAQVRYTLRASSRFVSSPAELLAGLDAILKDQHDGRSLCTALCLYLDPARSQVVVAVGGHPLPLCVTEERVSALGDYGPLIGGIAGATWTDHTLELSPGSTLLLYTDGVTDAIGPDGERFGLERLERCLEARGRATAADLIERVTAVLAGFEQGPQADDKAMLALRRRPDQIAAERPSVASPDAAMA